MKWLAGLRVFFRLGRRAAFVGSAGGDVTVDHSQQQVFVVTNNYFAAPAPEVPRDVRERRKFVYESLHMLRDGYPVKHLAVIDFMRREWRTERFMELDDAGLKRLNGYLRAVRREIDNDSGRPVGG